MDKMTPEQKVARGHELCEEIRKEIIADLDSRGTRKKVIDRLLEELEAEEIKYFQKDGRVEDERIVIAHGPRLKAIELLSSIYGLKAPDRHEVSAGKPIEEILAGIMAKRKAKSD